MAKQTVTLRLDEDDLTYLSQVEIHGAANLSEKIRALISEARAQRDGTDSYGAAHDFSRQLFSRVDREFNAAEVGSAKRSELSHRLLSWLPEAVAFTLAANQTTQPSSDTDVGLVAFELGLGERAFSLADSMIQLAQSDFSGCLARQQLTERASFLARQGR